MCCGGYDDVRDYDYCCDDDYGDVRDYDCYCGDDCGGDVCYDFYQTSIQGYLHLLCELSQ